jgi:hypothetical protein
VKQVVEASREHGPFDTRWVWARKESSDAVPTAARVRAAEAAEALGWDAFFNRYFRERRRHDSEARSAYAAYKQGREWRTTPARLSLVPTEDVSAPPDLAPEEGGTRRLLAAIAAAHPRRSAERLAPLTRRNEEEPMRMERSELERKRAELRRSLPGLSEERADSYRRYSDALALERAGVKYERPEEMVRLDEAEVAADAAIRDVQRELRDIDAEIELRRSGLGASVGCAVRRARADR